MIRPTMSHVLNKQDLYALMGAYATHLEAKIAELENEVEKEKWHYYALNNIRVDLLVRLNNLEAKALKEKGNE
jgi:hypothetical protein